MGADLKSESSSFPTTEGLTGGSESAKVHYLATSNTNQAFLGIGIAGVGRKSVRGYWSSLQSVHANDEVSITFDSGRIVPFTVIGIYDNQFPLSDDIAYITMSEAEKLMPATADHATAIYIRTKSGANVTQVVKSLSPLRSGVRFETSAELGSDVHDQAATFKLISNILKVISLLMAAITVFIITYIDLVNRRRQIGIQRAIGIKSGAIVMSYVWKALAYVLVGVAIGFSLFRYAITPFVASHPFQFPNGPVTLATTWSEMSRDVMILIIVAAVAALIPAIHSVRLRILDAIWG